MAKPVSLAIEKAKRGDPTALTELLQQHRHGLTAFFSGPMHWHWDQVPDLVQETMTRAVKGIRKFRGSTDGQARRWLYGIARNVHLQEVSRQVGIRLRRDVAAELAKHVPHTYDTPWLVCDILWALDELPLSQVEVLRLMLEGLTVREMAARLDVPEGTVATRIHRARKRLSALLGLGMPAARQSGAGTQEPGQG